MPEPVFHLAPSPGVLFMPCCGQMPFEGLGGRLTANPDRVTCPGAPEPFLPLGHVFRVPPAAPAAPYVDTVTSAPVVLGLAELADLVEQLTLPHPPLQAVMHPAAARFLLEQFAADVPPTGSLAYLGIPVFTDDTMPFGAWEIRAGDEVIESGTLRCEFTGPDPEGTK